MVRSSAALGSMAEALHILLPQRNENFGTFLGHPHISLLFFLASKDMHLGLQIVDCYLCRFMILFTSNKA
jgi:hypothetical protein